MTLKRAIVTAVGPLRIQIDGDTVPIPFTPKSLIYPDTLAVGDVVHADQSGHRLVVLGRVGGLGLLSGRNLIINGNFRTNQREYVSEESSVGYFFDRWEKLDNTKATSFTTAPQGQPILLGGSGAPRHLRQTIERNNLAAGTYVLSSAGTATARVYNKGGTAPSYAATPIVVTLDGTDDVRIEFKGSGDTVSKVQLEAGTIPTPFEQISVGEELALCQRYYRRILFSSGGASVGLGTYQSSTGESYIPIRHPVTMRVAATLSLSATSVLRMSIPGVWAANATAVTTEGSTVDGTTLKATTTSGLTAGAVYVYSSTAGWLEFDAEL